MSNSKSIIQSFLAISDFQIKIIFKYDCIIYINQYITFPIFCTEVHNFAYSVLYRPCTCVPRYIILRTRYCTDLVPVYRGT